MLPSGPEVAAMPGPGKPLERFAHEDGVCRDYAARSIGAKVNDVGANNVVSGAAVGTAVGAAAGALLGGHRGAANGAGAGLLVSASQVTLARTAGAWYRPHRTVHHRVSKLYNRG
jgi:YMGG-like Gly-zipper